ncbi:MAG: glutamate--tRNA ligase [Candidatus Heimdallarchaeota archaeon]|nr:glutamate--tRNA ligase [Candidatus Heimdallarchaeota archaeon]
MTDAQSPGELETLIKKYALENAIHHQGKAHEKSVMQKIMARHPELRKDAKKIVSEVERVVAEINQLTFEDQKNQLTTLAPELLEEKTATKRTYRLPKLKNAQRGKVITRYAPEPNGEMHLGHAFTAFFAHYYAKEYEGTFVLRFEDTNPKQERIEYMQAHRDALKWLELEPTVERIVSNDIPIFYEKAEELIKRNLAYTCNCPIDRLRELRAQMKACPHVKKTPKETMGEWKKMLKGEFAEGEMILRLRGDMKSQNAVMRDPAIFAIRKAKHCLQGRKYNVWPLYDFAVAIEDHLCGITHVGRSAEFDTRIELQNKIRELLDLLPHPEIFHYARFNVIGSPASKRKIIPLIQEGKVEGWDDIRLVTIKGLQRRGIVPETIKQIAVQVGMTTQPTNIDWSLIAATNRKIIDPIANRFFFVPDPVVLYVQNITKERVCEPLCHPDHPERGRRTLLAGNLFLIAHTDFDQLAKGEEFRLKDLFNVKLVAKNVDLTKQSLKIVRGSEEFLTKYKTHAIAEFTGNELKPGAKIQWVPAQPSAIVPVKVKVPDVLFVENTFNKKSLTIVSGIAEKAFAKLKVGDLAQFERFGFVRVDKKTKDCLYVNLAHK